METKFSKDVQKKFSCLFPKGTVMEVMTVASDNDVPNLVKSAGGCYGLLVHGYDFPLKTRITTVVIGQHNGMPLLEPAKEWLMSYAPHRAYVLFSTPLGVAMRLKDAENQYVSYLCEQGIPEHLQQLKNGDEVVVYGLKKWQMTCMLPPMWSCPSASGSYKCYRSTVLVEFVQLLNEEY